MIIAILSALLMQKTNCMHHLMKDCRQTSTSRTQIKILSTYLSANRRGTSVGNKYIVHFESTTLSKIYVEMLLHQVLLRPTKHSNSVRYRGEDEKNSDTFLRHNQYYHMCIRIMFQNVASDLFKN